MYKYKMYIVRSININKVIIHLHKSLSEIKN